MSITDIVKMKEKEMVVAVIRHYPVVYAPRILVALLLVSAPFFFMIPLFAIRPLNFPLGPIIFGLAVLAGLYLALRIFVIWYWNAFVITTYRVIDVDQRGLFDRTVSEALFDKVQDVSYHVKGVWGTMLHYGTIIVQTAGTTTNLELYYVRHPKNVHHLLTELVSAHRSGPPAERSERVAELLEAAADLSDAEARAFLTEIKSAISEKPEPPHVDDRDVEQLMDGPPAADK